jgi:pyruvate,water dikinase
VLVVRTLSPSLAAHLPVVAGIVSETGRVLSHLAILAREYHVPTVVAVHDALHRFPEGIQLLVDGDTGEVVVLDGAAGGVERSGEDGPMRPFARKDAPVDHDGPVDDGPVDDRSGGGRS